MDIEELILLAKEKRASDIHLVAGVAPMLRIDGELRPLVEFGELNHHNIEQLFREVANPRLEDRLHEELEVVKIPDKPYDVLVHQIAGLMLKNRRLEFSAVLEIAHNAAPYENLTLKDIEKAFKYMPRVATEDYNFEVYFQVCSEVK